MNYRVNRGKYASFSGRIVELIPHGVNGGIQEGCMLLAGVEDEAGNRNNFVIHKNTFVVDFLTLRTGMQCTFWYATDVPMVLIYPPQYRAAVAARQDESRSVDVAYYNEKLINDTDTLRLNLDKDSRVRTTNNQIYAGNPGEKDLVVIYDMTTRSIPAQTIPLEVYVLCE